MKRFSGFKALTATSLVFAAVGVSVSADAAPVFSEDFGNLANGTTITTSNTDFTYVRVGTGGGSITALNPSTLSTGASMVLAGPTSTSLNGVGVQSGLGLTDEAELSFKLKFADVSSGTLFIGMGSGTMFTGNGTFAGGSLFFGLQSLSGVLQYRDNSGASGNWVNAGFTFVDDTDYDMAIFGNGSDLQISINGSPLALITDSRNSQNADAFRIYAVSGAVSYELDDIIVQVPEPSTFALLGCGAIGLAVYAKRRRR